MEEKTKRRTKRNSFTQSCFNANSDSILLSSTQGPVALSEVENNRRQTKKRKNCVKIKKVDSHGKIERKEAREKIAKWKLVMQKQKQKQKRKKYRKKVKKTVK